MILYFTGTGNSYHAAKVLAEQLEDQLVSLNKMMKAGEDVTLTSETPFVVVAPVYCWRIPRVVEDFLNKVTFEGNKDMAFILTCGDSIGDAGTYAKRFCEEKGLNYKGMAEVVMPENYITMFKAPEPDKEAQIMKVADHRIKQIGAKLAKGEVLTQKGKKFKVLSTIVNPVFYKLFMTAKPFWVKEECSGCGFCEKICPVNNIRIEDGRPVWGDNCTQCMACICGCPEEAIEYGKKALGKRRYWCKGFDK